MKKHYLNLLALLLMVFVSGSLFSSCSNDDDAPSQETVLQNAEGVIALTEGIGEWDAAYLTKSGYFCYDGDISEEGSTETSKYSSVTFMPADASEVLSIVSSKLENFPVQLVASEGVYLFSFPNDTILELLYDNGESVTMIDSIAYNRDELLLLSQSKGDAFKATLATTASLLKSNVTRSLASDVRWGDYIKIFEIVSNEPYVDSPEIVDQIASDGEGNFDFADKMGQWYDNEMDELVRYTLSIWTGNAKFKVGGSSCTLSGTIWCNTDKYNDYGVYGILCDANPDNLVVGSAEYEGVGRQVGDDLSFSVDFRGFKPKTTYYYRAYYKFNTTDHGNIVPKHGELNVEVIYDNTIKSFTTGDNMLTVDVVMCIDVTGSMYDIINTVKSNAIAFYDLFKKSCDEEGIILTGLNSQVVAFRDKNVDASWLDVSPTYSLPEEKSNFDSFVNGLYASGGGDAPESALEALDAAFSKTDWGVDDGYHRQVIILWTDVPYLVGEAYTDLTTDIVKSKWDAMPSGRRMILFAPNGTYGSNSGDWAVFDDWKNVIHETDLSSGFNDFEYILKSIIGELTSKGKAPATRTVTDESVFFRPNY